MRLFILLFLAPFFILAQQKYSLTGSVTEKGNTVVPGAAAMHSWFATYPRAFEKLGVSVDDQKAVTLKNWKTYRERSIAVGKAFAKEVIKYHKVTK